MDTLEFKGALYKIGEIKELYINQNLTLREAYEKLSLNKSLSIKEFKSLVKKIGLVKTRDNRSKSQGLKGSKLTQEIISCIEKSSKGLEDFPSKFSYAKFLNEENPNFSVRQFEKRISTEETKKSKIFFDVYPELKDFVYEYIDPEIESATVSSHIRIKWQCENNHVYTRSFYEMNRVKKSCYYCSNQKVLEGFNDLESQFPEISLDYSSNNKIKANEIYCRSTKIVEWQCHRCGVVWSQAVCNRTSYSKAECPSCSDKTSKYELKVVNFISSVYEKEILRNKMPIRSSTSRLQIDIWLPDIGLGFEIQDLATHSKSSDTEMSNFRNLNIFKKGPAYHESKRKLAKDRINVTLVDIWQDEIESGEFEEIVLKHIKRAMR